MKKFRVGISFVFVVLICLIFKNFLLLLNYLIALILHELAHLFVATTRGYKLKQACLDMFGLSITLDEKIADSDSFAINLAGPMFNFILCLVCMSLYWLIPASQRVLNLFCLSNFCLAIFNLLPIYPLDGGKIFRSMIRTDKAYKILDRTIRIIFSLAFLVLFVLSCFNKINFFYLVMVLFFVTSRPPSTSTLTLFKTLKEKNFNKIVLLKVNETTTLFDLLKKIQSKTYTIFYCNTLKNPYIDEDMLINYSIRYPLDSKLINVLPSK